MASPPPVKHSLVAALEHVPAFASLDDHMLLELVGSSANLFYRAGAPVFEPGDRAEALFIVLAGRVAIHDGERHIADIEPGDVFGEIALLAETTRTRTARVACDSELVVVPRAWFLELLEDEPDLAERFRRTAELRRREAEAAPA